MLHDIDEPRCVRSLHHLPKPPAQIIAQRRAGPCRRDHRKSVLGSIGIGRAAAGIQIAAPIIAKRRRTCRHPIRPQYQDLHGNHRHRSRRHLVALTSPDPGKLVP